MTGWVVRGAAAWFVAGSVITVLSTESWWGYLYGWVGLLGLLASEGVGRLLDRWSRRGFDEDAAGEALSAGVFVDPAELDRLADEPLPRITK